MVSKCLLIIALVICGALSIGLKLMGKVDLNTAQTREIETLTHYMSARDHVLTERFNLNREGSFIAHIYRHKKCDGGWLISPMYRNSEAVSLFTRQAIYRHYDMGAVMYLLNGQSYQSFPDWDLWLSHKIEALKAMIALGDGGLKPVFAVRSFGHCQKEVSL